MQSNAVNENSRFQEKKTFELNAKQKFKHNQTQVGQSSRFQKSNVQKTFGIDFKMTKKLTSIDLKIVSNGMQKSSAFVRACWFVLQSTFKVISHLETNLNFKHHKHQKTNPKSKLRLKT